ncbi:hypothetical protein ACQW02_13135 [Humitalea sp. 24SJ18S-53]|uniref:hypothetical protein n=1 Tax=Humitalea sp. 24SJ18S-53 TaxID=3422307 RepID=UPI003D678CDE
MIPDAWAARAAELAQAMVATAARLPQDWPKEHPPANPVCGDTTFTGEQKND